MINIHVNAAYLLYDSFAMMPVKNGEVTVLLDGRAYRPIYKEGGYFVFSNVELGMHRIIFSSPKFCEYTVDVEFAQKKCITDNIILLPSEKYLFGKSVSRLEITGNNEVYLAWANPIYALKVSKPKIAVGDLQAKLMYQEHAFSHFLLPGNYLFCDKNPSICQIDEIIGEDAFLHSPLECDYKRNTTVYHALKYSINGKITACFAGDGEVYVINLQPKLAVEKVGLIIDQCIKVTI